MSTRSPFQPEAYGRYYLVDKIAVGGMAEVFKARRFSDGGFQMLLVIKRILQQFSENDEFVQMFVDEAKISVQLQHPNIVQIYDFGKLRDNYFIAMECVEGKDLKGILRGLARRRKLMPQEYAVYIAHEICKGLFYAHTKTDMDGKPLAIVHRDISPSNILISYGGDIKIADFGIAKAQTSAYTTKDGVLKGKFEYMSPEQASGQAVTALSDQFSVGILLHEMLTGRRLFKTDSDIKTLEKIKAVDIQPPSARNPRVPPQLDAIVMRALSRDPKDRFRDCKELQTALAEHLYPATPSMTADSLGAFMKELFREDIQDERSRLQTGTRIATNLHEQSLVPDMATEEWTAGFTDTLKKSQGELPDIPTTPGTRPPSRAPLIAGALVLLLLLGGGGAYLLGPALFGPGEPDPTPDPPPEEIAAPTEAPGILQVQLRPEGTSGVFFLDGAPVDEGVLATTLEREVPPGASVTLRVEAEGFKPHEEKLTLAAGERLRLPVTLQALPAATPTPPPREVTPPPPREVVVSTPPPPRETTPPPEAPPADPGKVVVNVKGWANVYINGQKRGETPLTVKLPPGSYSIRVENPETGYSASTSVEVSSGKTSRVTL